MSGPRRGRAPGDPRYPPAMSRDAPSPRPPELEPDWQPVATPPAGPRDDELLADPPQGEYHRGRFAGYGAGRRARRALLICIGLLLIVTTVVWYQWATRERPRATVRQFQLPAGTDLDDRPRVLTWSEGKARLGLSREPPGVHTIELPDRTLRLAAGSDQAQFKVIVEDGKTTALDIISGVVVEDLQPGAAPLVTD